MNSVAATELIIRGVDGHPASTCKGDSGGPVLRDGSSDEIVAIHSSSWQSGCLGVSETRDESIEARVDDIADWISKNTNAVVPTEPDYVRCVKPAPVYAVNEQALLYGDGDPENGTHDLSQPTVVGQAGWDAFGKVLAGPDNLVYAIDRNGNIFRYLLVDGDLKNGQNIGHGWNRFVDPSAMNQITIDKTGAFYTVESDGKLVRRVFDHNAVKWTSVTVDEGWSKYNLIVAAGEGVIYSRDAAGQFYRNRYDSATNSWPMKAKNVGSAGRGWNGYSSVTSLGGDILYAVTNGGGVHWYRYLVNANKWVDGSPKEIGKGGWKAFRSVVATPNSCSLEVDPAKLITCRPEAPIYAADDQLLEYRDPQPEESSSHGAPRTIGLGGWREFARVLSAPNGRIYAISPDGKMYLYHWNGSSWSFERRLIGQGWEIYTRDHRNQVTVDQNGYIYTLDKAGTLTWHSYDERSTSWSKRVLASDWKSLDMIVGAGDGVLYSRGDNGALYRSSYDHKTQSWTEKSKKVGLGGWGIYKSVTSAGGDTLYGVRDNGELVWYRYLNSAGHWHKADSGVVIGLGGWTQFYDVVADPSACRLTG